VPLLARNRHDLARALDHAHWCRVERLDHTLGVLARGWIECQALLLGVGLELGVFDR